VSERALVERESQLAMLHEAFGSAERRRGRAVLLAGEAGAGKSALAAALLDDLERRARVVRSYCQDIANPPPLGVVRDAARGLGARLAHGFVDELPVHELFDRMLTEIEDAHVPVAWLVEDVHWADERSLDLLRFLARRLRALPLLLLVTYRDTEVNPLLLALLGELATVPEVRRISVPALSEDGVRELSGLHATDAAALHARTGGNAFFVSELLREPDAAGGARDFVLGRAARLAAPARELLDALAVLGDRCPVELAERAHGALDALDELRGMVFVDDAGTIRFRHDIVREAVLAGLPASRRVTLHRNALTALGAGADPAVAVTHALGAGDRAATAHWAPKAAERSIAVGSVRQAAREFGAAAAATDVVDDAARLRARQASVLADAGEFEAALTVFESTDTTLCSDAARAEVWAARARTHGRRMQGDEGDRWLARALAAVELVPADERPASPYAVAAGQAMLRHDTDAVERYGKQAIELALRRGERVLAADVRVTIGSVQAREDPSARALRAAIEGARREGAEGAVIRGLNNLASALSVGGQLTEALEVIEQTVVLCVQRDLDDILGRLQVSRASALLELGRYAESVAVCETLLTDPRHSWRGGAPGICAVALARTGRLRGRELLDQELRIGAASSDMVVRVMGRVSAAEIAWLASDSASAELDDLVALHAVLVADNSTLRSLVAGWCRLLGGPVLSADGDDMFALAADGEFVGAAERFGARGMLYHQALCLYRADSVDALRRAYDIAASLETTPLALRIKSRLAERGEVVARRRGVGRTTAANPAGLSAREVDVLRLLAEGLRNAEIGELLVLSPRTVDRHVSNILRKLNISSRAAAVTVAHALGIASA
jgi:DNA-binding CsgD family transcriptional regulator